MISILRQFSFSLFLLLGCFGYGTFGFSPSRTCHSTTLLSRHAQSRPFRLSAKSNREDPSDIPNGNAVSTNSDTFESIAQLKRRRLADYPSFSYTVSNGRKKKRPDGTRGKMKYRGCGCEDVRFSKPPVVSIPETDRESMNVLEKLAFNFYGGFESGLGDIGISALRTRLLKNRSYAKKEPFALNNITVPPSLSDLSYPPSSQSKGLWVGFPARIVTGVVAYMVFPYLTSFLERFVTMPPAQLDDITSKFGPGVSILYGTFISLTLSILYQRVKDLQDAAARESALLTLVTRNLLSIFKADRELAIVAAQCCADQVRTIVKSSRGREMMQARR